MALATTSDGGDLRFINEERCRITIPNYGVIKLKILPEVSDTKKATYADQTIIGRSFPIKTYSHSDNRVIAMKLHFIVVKSSDIDQNLADLNGIRSAVYPRRGDGDAPYKPPPVCTISCGDLFGEDPICVVLENYSVNFPTNVAWDKETLLPYYFQVSTNWHVVYSSDNLPNQETILR